MIQNTWTYVYKSPFLNCSNELNIVVGNEVESILPYVFMGGERKGEYKNNTWSYTLSVLPRADIKSIVVKQNNKLKTISSYAFAGCSNLEYVYNVRGGGVTPDDTSFVGTKITVTDGQIQFAKK